MDREVQRIIHWSFQGSTAVAIWIHEERNNNNNNNMGNNSNNNEDDSATKKTIIAANIGDSRAIVAKKGHKTPEKLNAIALSYDQTPYRKVGTG